MIEISHMKQETSLTAKHETHLFWFGSEVILKIHDPITAYSIGESMVIDLITYKIKDISHYPKEVRTDYTLGV